MIKAYVDSSYDEKRKIAGFGIVIFEGEKARIYSNYIPAPSNNYGEMWAIYQASILLGGKTDAVIYTDSMTSLLYIHGDIHEKKRTREQYIEHKHMEVLAHKIKRLNIPCKKVKAHHDVMQTHFIGNKMADLLAKNGRAKLYEQERLKKYLTNHSR